MLDPEEDDPSRLDLVSAAIVVGDPLAPAAVGAGRALAPSSREEAIHSIADLLGRPETEVAATLRRLDVAGMILDGGEVSPEARWLVQRALEDRPTRGR